MDPHTALCRAEECRGRTEYWIGYLGNADGKPAGKGDIFGSAGFMPRADGSWGSYVKVTGPYRTYAEAQNRRRDYGNGEE